MPMDDAVDAAIHAAAWLTLPSDDGPVRDHGILGNHHDAVADVVGGRVALALPLFVEDANTPPHPRVLVDDGVLDDAPGPDADGRPAFPLGAPDLLSALVQVRAQNQAVADVGPVGDPSANADQRALDVRLVDERALRDQ